VEESNQIKSLQQYYRENPLMVSSPFGPPEKADKLLFNDKLAELGVSIENKDILDVGCGKGVGACLTAEKSARYTGIDIVLSEPNMVKRAPFIIGSAIHCHLQIALSIQYSA